MRYMYVVGAGRGHVDGGGEWGIWAVQPRLVFFFGLDGWKGSKL